ncbi:hypothetical protein HMPREF9318_02136 [Streptococcus urinalis FB127-CNA-2]|uniref:Glycosyltransferase, group 1 family protein n=1 Tax=Streptococcus urinalis 2285-97 TaxID=764291 RepID=G5KIC7_9STRE|nr:glycosyltransferase [Streptococcus urinalis]EHJ55670.1 glycosyltransferase, group 1 family protein [Streptococcus urinalis 2285-97]EKS17259.1 hypothetical protein HMPREF9318_02136 [Streptococcus urinalis FB127-CNA-2]VEF32491.1 glycosyltransferase, group 1 family protein [Streptococcus urinalis]
MKVLLYLEAEKYIRQSGIGRAIKHQEKALDIAGIPYTTNPKEHYDLVHINTNGPFSWYLMRKAQNLGKKVIIHGHSTEEDFRNSFIFSNALAPLFRRHLCRFYRQADAIITPTQYSKELIKAYGIKTPIYAVSNGIEIEKYGPKPEKEASFREYFNLKENQKVVICAGLYFMRKGIDDFIKVAEKMPDVTFIWFGETNKWIIPKQVRDIVTTNHPTNVLFPGYIKGDVFEGAMSGADAFFFPSREETEGIVVLEALASHQNVILRDIPVYKDWIPEEAVTYEKDVNGFVKAIREVLQSEDNKGEIGFKVAQSKDLATIAQQLGNVYQTVMEN